MTSRSCKSGQLLPGIIAVIPFMVLVMTGCTDAESSQQHNELPAIFELIQLEDVTEKAGLGDFIHKTGAFGEKLFPETMGSGGGFLDYDNDGWLDIILVGGGVFPESKDRIEHVLWLYRNNRDGTFSLHSREAGLDTVPEDTYGFGIAAADFDNDGDEDFFLTTLAENMLFRNDGGVFTEVGKTAGVAGLPAWSSVPIFFNADRDAWPDLYVGNYVEWSQETEVFCTVNGTEKSYCTPLLYKGLAGWFYKNNGDGTFTDHTQQAGFAGSPGKTLGAAELDYNQDGWSDLVVSNDLARNLLYVNNKDGTFKESGMPTGIAFDNNGVARSGMGVDAGVIDSTGIPAVFIGNFSKQMIGVYRSLGNGVFMDRADVSGIGRPSWLVLTFGLFLFDIDLDGDLDLFTVNGEVRDDVHRSGDGVTYRQPANLYVNSGNGIFDLVDGTNNLLGKELVARGASYADYDRDGDLDILITENGGPVHLWRNNHPDPNFLRVRVQGSSCGRDALGTRIIAATGDLRMERRVRTGSSYLSQSEKTVTFGLAHKKQVDSLIVQWPCGRIDRFANVAGKQEILIMEEVQHYQVIKPGI